jgi:hypothetical protein
MQPSLFEGVVHAAGVLEALAASIGSGVVVGGFVGGAGNFAWTRSRMASEKWALIGTYLGGFVGLGLLAFDIVRERFV